MKFKRNNGFSLIELMVVVAIMGILASIAVPQFQKFQSRTRQSEAKNSLSAIFTAEKSFFVEWTNYHHNLNLIGVDVDAAPGEMRYNAGFAAACTNFQGSVATTAGDMDLLTIKGAANFRSANVPAITGTACDNAVGAQVFTSSAQGYPGADEATADEWTINQDKALVNRVNGI